MLNLMIEVTCDDVMGKWLNTLKKYDFANLNVVNIC